MSLTSYHTRTDGEDCEIQEKSSSNRDFYDGMLG